jgi:type IV pilus assembly protein PilB
MSDDFTLRTVPPAGTSEPATESGALGPAAAPPINMTAELLADLLAATGLVPADKLALARGRAGATGSLAQALVDEGVAEPEGIARTLAARYQLPLVDLATVGVDAEAANLLPLHVLERVTAIPYATDGSILRVAVADPSDVHAIDELRIATRLTVELAVATRDDVEAEIRRIVRASEAFGARAAL